MESLEQGLRLCHSCVEEWFADSIFCRNNRVCEGRVQMIVCNQRCYLCQINVLCFKNSIRYIPGVRICSAIEIMCSAIEILRKTALADFVEPGC